VHPNLLHIGSFTLPTFGALVAVGLMLALTLSQRTARLVAIDPDKLWDAGLFAVLAAFVLSRLVLVATHFATFQQFPILLLAVPSLTPLGLLLTAIATLIWLYFARIPVLRALDAWAPCASLVWVFLALGHYAEASDPGLPILISWPGQASPLYPVALYVAFFAALITAAVYKYLGRPHSTGQAAAVTLVAAGTTQFLISFLRQPGLSSIADLDVVQVVALGMIVAGGVLAVSSQLKNS